MKVSWAREVCSAVAMDFEYVYANWNCNPADILRRRSTVIPLYQESPCVPVASMVSTRGFRRAPFTGAVSTPSTNAVSGAL